MYVPTLALSLSLHLYHPLCPIYNVSLKTVQRQGDMQNERDACTSADVM
jgi:hypothetical protein